MPNTDELERIADDMWKDRRITSPTYCEKCGYNLRTLPHVHNCPECGSEYNARPLLMKGIFLPQVGMAPIFETWLIFIWAGMGAVVAWASPRPFEPAIWGIIGACAALCAVSLGMAFRGWRKLIRHKMVENRILQEEDED